MSKYIRTKDGIIDLSKVTIGENGWKSIEEYIAFKQDDQQEPIKQADTIEELIHFGDLVVLHSCTLHKYTTILHMTIIYGDAKRMGFVFGKNDIDELYIKQSNGDWKLVAKKEKRKLELL